MPRSSVIIATYFHLPGGSDGSAFETLYQGSLKPFLSGLYRFPQVPIAVYLSGPLIERLESEHPEYLMLLKEMVGRKQVEIIGGGWANPFFPLIPQTDRLGQIEELTTTVRRMLGRRPLGCILAKGLWEQQMASALQAAGMDYTFLPESSFKSSGVPHHFPHMTEDQGRTVAVIPVCEELSENLPADALAARELILKKAEERSLLTILARGDSFFNSPPEPSQAEATFASLFSAIRDMAVDMDFSTPSRFLRGMALKPRAYFRDSHARDVITRSPEIGRLYARMQYTQLQVNQLKGDKARKKQARLELWKAQDCNAYLPGGGDDASRCRARAWAYRSLLEAERIVRGKTGFTASILPVDYDFDGSSEYLCQSVDMNAFAHLVGGRIVELDLIPLGWNALNVSEAGDNPGLFDDEFALEGAKAPLRPRALYTVDEQGRNGLELRLSSEFPLISGQHRVMLRIEKRYAFRKSGFNLSFALVNIGTGEIKGSYHLLACLSLLLREVNLRPRIKVSPQADDAAEENAHDGHGNAEGLEIIDERGKSILDLSAIHPCSFSLQDPPATNDGGIVPSFSATLSWPLALIPGQRFEGGVQVAFHSRRSS